MTESTLCKNQPGSCQRVPLVNGAGRSALAAAFLIATIVPFPAQAAPVNLSVNHTFTIQDVQGDLATGSTFADNPAILCGAIGAPPCPADGPQPFLSDGTTLYPIDSEFGFYAVDFVGGFPKQLDGLYTEGFIGTRVDGNGTGVMISNAATDKFKTQKPVGTWCAGMGGTSVKCSTENFAVMEHVLTCHETIPYFYADPVTGAQTVLADPETGVPVFTCADAQLNSFDDLTLPDGVPDLLSLEPNESNVIDVAVGADYSVTLKDDGKFLFRWGTFVKRPNDVRLYARLPLPDAWKQPGADFAVTSATLTVTHWITNNPNDQIRPEDMENEGATGRKPGYVVQPDGSWLSDRDCFEGDGDGTRLSLRSPLVRIPEGTYLKNLTGYTPSPDPRAQRVADLTEGFTNAWATSIDRDPFEWSYDADPDPMFQDFVGSQTPNPALGELVSGPRWRLRANKFGQDIPGLEIPTVECSPLPFASNNIKYETGSFTTTVINLLDFEDVNENGLADDSPLLRTPAWIDASQNFVNLGAGGSSAEPNGVSVNGLPLTDDFDLAIYIKGDRKPTVVYEATLDVEWDDGTRAGRIATALQTGSGE